MVEQGYICCYCGRRVSEADSHIEHLKPRCPFREEEVNYGNLLCSCQRQVERREPLHCGTLKGDWYDESLFVSPLKADCETRFRFAADGAIYPRRDEDRGARETIGRLGLDIPKLRAMRRKAIDGALQDLDSLTDDDILRLVDAFARRDADGRHAECCFAVGYVLLTLVAQTPGSRPYLPSGDSISASSTSVS